MYKEKATQIYLLVQCTLKFEVHNDSSAVEWYREAADQRYEEAQSNLGGMHEKGRGVDQNDSSAVEWYRKAAEEGHDEAQSNLDRLTKRQRMEKENYGYADRSFTYFDC